jgi:hypothetical protein
MPHSDEKKNDAVSGDELIAAVTSGQTTQAAPPSAAPEGVKQPGIESGMFLHKYPDGSTATLYKYVIDGETIITPKPIEQMSIEDYDRSPFSLASSSANRIPQDLTVKFKDPQWCGQWFNRSAKDGRRVQIARTLGFVPAKIEDCEWVSHSLNDADGAITDGDLVLFKIHKAKLLSFSKGHMDEARKMGNKDSYLSQAQGAVPGNNSGMVSHYFTQQANQEFSGLGPVVSNPETALIGQRG